MYAVWLFVRLPHSNGGGHRRSDGACAGTGSYSRKFALSTIAAAGMLGTIIPPSTVMITYCSATGVSVGSMFMAGIVPGITLGALMIAFAIFYWRKKVGNP